MHQTLKTKLASKAITPKETEGLTLDPKRITETPLYSPNDIKTTDEDSKKQVEKYIKELQMLDNARIELENTEDDYSNAVDIKSKNHIMKNILKKAHKTHNLEKDEIISLLADDNINEALFKAADKVRSEFVGDEIHLRGLIEFSNICKRNCL